MRRFSIIQVLALSAGMTLAGCQSLMEARYPGSTTSTPNDYANNDTGGIADNLNTNSAPPANHLSLKYDDSAARSIADSNEVNGSDKPPTNIKDRSASDR